MNVEIHLEMPSNDELNKRRPCGCLKHSISDFGHWWKYTRIRLFFRSVSGWRLFIWWHLWTRWNERICRIRAYCIPIAFQFGMINMADAISLEDSWLDWAETWIKTRKQFLFLYADQDHPDGVYAKSGFDLLPMTCDEYEHWYGKRPEEPTAEDILS